MKRFLLATAIGCVALGAGGAQQHPGATGVIRGRVIDDMGLWVAGATVDVNIQDGLPRMGYVMPNAETDKDGVFVIDHLEWGRYEVFARKEEDGYLNTFQAHVYYVEIPPPSAELTPEEPTADIVVPLPRAGKIVWSATDAVTGKPVSVSMKMFRWAEGNGDPSRSLWGMGSGFGGSQPNQYWIPAPPQVEVGLAASAEGYEVWRWPKPVRLKAGDTLTLDIKLQPLAK